VVPVPTAQDRRADQRAAVAAAELLATLARGARRATARGCLCARALLDGCALWLLATTAISFAPGEIVPRVLDLSEVVLVLV
jgi:hypothetical protein